MANLMAEGTWPCTVLNGTFGENDKGDPRVQINVRIDDGPSTGRTCTYEDQVNNKSALYIGRSCRAVGWKGVALETLKTDIQEWVTATGGKTTVEIKHIPIKTGKRAGEIWDKPNSLGRGARPLREPTPERLEDANAAMRAAMEADGYAQPRDDEDDSMPF